VRYGGIEAGHACQNLLLQAVALGPGGAVADAFDGAYVKRLLRLPDRERPLVAIHPVGHPRQRHGQTVPDGFAPKGGCRTIPKQTDTARSLT
jgi:hypothetical protein